MLLKSGFYETALVRKQGALGQEETALMGGTFRAETVHAGDYWPQSRNKPELYYLKQWNGSLSYYKL